MWIENKVDCPRGRLNLQWTLRLSMKQPPQSRFIC